tara:strand:+ start:4815 stop:5105 length:291 start_codon:yes stop_codon:yes gene_type:complete
MTESKVIENNVEYNVTVDEKGSKAWYLNNQLHREDGPTIEMADGTKAWYLNGNPHRVDGPAVEFSSGTKRWFIHGEQVTEEEFKEVTYLKDVIKTL